MNIGNTKVLVWSSKMCEDHITKTYNWFLTRKGGRILFKKRGFEAGKKIQQFKY